MSAVSRLLCLIAALSCLALGARQAVAQGAPFANDGRLYQVRYITTGGDRSDVIRLDRYNFGAGTVVLSTTGGLVINALAQHPTDGYLYALRILSGSRNELFRIGQGGIARLGTVTGLPTAVNSNSGTFDAAGNYYIYGAPVAAGDPAILYRVSGVTNAPVTAAGAATGVTVTPITLSAALGSADFAVNPTNGLLYGVGGASGPQTLVTINPATGAVTNTPITISPVAGQPATLSATFGTAFFDLTGTLYAYANGAVATPNSGQFFVINISANPVTAVYLASGTPTSQSDGASNPFFSIPLPTTKTLTNSVAVDDRTFDFTFDIQVANQSGTAAAENLQITDDLSRVFTINTPTITITAPPTIVAGAALATNPAYTGLPDGTTYSRSTGLLAGTSTLAPGTSVTVRFTTRVQYAAATQVPAQETNTVQVSSTSTRNPSGYNAGFTFPAGSPLPPPDVTGVNQPPGTNASFRFIRGTVFEDVDYGGGAGRPLGTAGTAAVPAGTRVELYSVTGTTATFVEAALTNAAGQYVFDDLAAGNYAVRVVSNSVVSTRPTTGIVGATVPVQTFRTNNATPDTNRVGGENPSVPDGAIGAAGTTINTATGALSTGGVAHSLGLVTVTTATINPGVSGIDFGFNFDTIVNTNNAGQGSLRQFIVNSNVLANGGLAQVGQVAGVENTIFMVDTTRLTNNVARIGITAALPAIADANTSINGATQTVNIGDTNTATLGTAASVGTGGTNLPALPGPEVEIYDLGGVGAGLSVQAANTTIRRIAIYGFGNAPGANGQGNIVVGNFASTLIEQNAIGSTALSFSDPSGAPGGRSGGDNIHVLQGDTGTITGNLIGYSAGAGVTLAGQGGDGAQGWQVTQNQVLGNGIGNPGLGGVSIAGSGSATVQDNLLAGNQGPGLDTNNGLGANAISNNTITSNGAGSGAGAVPSGVRLSGNGSTLLNNIIANNGGAGVLVVPTAQSNVITRNSISGNGGNSGTGTNQLGIDLLEAGQNTLTGTSVAGRGHVTPNDAGDGDSGANGLLNFPVLDRVTLDATTGLVTITGWSRPGAAIEFFVAAPDPSGFGEGQTFIASLTEGSSADGDATTSTYDTPVPNVGTDTTNRFSFTIPRGALNFGSVLTATATLGSSTSEFSNNVAVTTNAAAVSGRVYLDANANEVLDNGEVSTNLTGLFVKAFLLDANGAPAATATAAVPVDAASGAFSFTTLVAGRYRLVLDDNATPTDATPVDIGARGFVGTEAPGGIRDDVVVVAGGRATPQQNFGLYAGSRLSGLVFNDNGLGTGGVPADGIRQPGEAPLPGVTVRALSAGGQVLDTAQTNAQGAYTLFVPAGAQVSAVETNPGGFVSAGAALGNSGGAYNRATDAIAFTPTAGTIYAGLNFGDVRAATLEKSSSLTTTPGGSVLLPHTFTAYTPGQVTFAISSVATPTNVAFTRVLYRDLNCNGVLDGTESNAPITAPLTVTKAQVDAGGGEVPICVLIKEFAPSNAPQGAQDKLTLQATFDYTETGVPALANAVLTQPDTVIVKQTGDLVLTKAASTATAAPGQPVTYRITYLNQGEAPLQNLVIQDVVPAFTTFTSQSNGPLPAGLTAPVFAQSGKSLTWTFGGALAPNATGYVEFTVQLNQ